MAFSFNKFSMPSETKNISLNCLLEWYEMDISQYIVFIKGINFVHVFSKR